VCPGGQERRERLHRLLGCTSWKNANAPFRTITAAIAIASEAVPLVCRETLTARAESARALARPANSRATTPI